MTQTETKRTPGPYEVVPADISDIYLIYPKGDYSGHIGEAHGLNAKADADFFASAPTMQARIEELEAENERLEDQVSDLTDKVNELDDQVNEQEDQIAELENENTDLSRNLSTR